MNKALNRGSATDLILAESYLDTGDGISFANSGGATALHPARGNEARDVGLVMAALGYTPLCVTGPQVDAARQAPAAADRTKGHPALRQAA